MLGGKRVLLVTRCEVSGWEAAFGINVRGTESGMRAAASLDTPRDELGQQRKRLTSPRECAGVESHGSMMHPTERQHNWRGWRRVG